MRIFSAILSFLVVVSLSQVMTRDCFTCVAPTVRMACDKTMMGKSSHHGCCASKVQASISSACACAVSPATPIAAEDLIYDALTRVFAKVFLLPVDSGVKLAMFHHLTALSRSPPGLFSHAMDRLALKQSFLI